MHFAIAKSASGIKLTLPNNQPGVFSLFIHCSTSDGAYVISPEIKLEVLSKVELVQREEEEANKYSNASAFIDSISGLGLMTIKFDTKFRN